MRAAARAVVFLLLCAILIPVQIAIVTLNLRRLQFAMPLLLWGISTRMFGFEIVVRGTPSAARPTLFVANHASYLDIMILSSLLPSGYVSKAEVRGWPLFGLMARLINTVFIDRRSRNVKQHESGIQSTLGSGANLILFPEGTSTDGNGVQTFKSSLFGVCALPLPTGPLPVQPVAISYVALDGMALGRELRPLYAWYGDMTLGPHLWQVLKLGRSLVIVEFLDTVDLPRFGSRKALADHCQSVVARAVGAANACRLPEIEQRLLPPLEEKSVS